MSIVENSLVVNRNSKPCDIITFTFMGTLQEAALLRTAIMDEIPTYAIDIVIFDRNISALKDEYFAARLGQLIIDNTRLTDELKDKRLDFSFSGPIKLTTGDLQKVHNIPFIGNRTSETTFKGVIPLIDLRVGEVLTFGILIKEGIGNSHPKWRPVSVINFDDELNTIPMEQARPIKFTMESRGLLSPDKILEEGMKRRNAPLERPPQTIYDRY